MTAMKLVIDGDPTPDHLLDRDRQLESLSGLTRRQVLILFANMVAASGGISVLGCSSGTPTGSNPPPPPNTGTNTSLPQVNGTVVLPSGSTLSTNTLTLQSMGQRIPLPSAAFGIGVSPNSPSLALVTDTHGNGIMAGFLDVTGAIPPAITPHSTGVVLSWFALGGPFVPANLKAQLLSLLDADPTMSTLGGVMASRIAADPLAVVNGDAQIATALNTALDALNNGATSTISPESLRDDPPPTIKVSPTVAQGGVSVRLDNAIVGVDIANTYRRPVQVYVYEVQTKTLIGTSEVPTDISPAKLVAGPFDMGEPTAFTALGGLLAFLAQPAPFKSVTLGPIGLGLDGTSDETSYEIVVIGPSLSGVTPALFGAPRYANAVAGWNAAIDVMFARVYFCDLIYALLLEATGFGSVLPTSPNLVAAGVNTKKFAGIPFSASSGLPSGVPATLPLLNRSFQNMLQQSDLLAQYQAQAPNIMDKLEAAALQQVNRVDWQASAQTVSNFVMKLGSPFANYKANGALSKLLANLANADAGLLWSAVVDKSKATILPPGPSVELGGQVTLSVVLSPDLTSTYEFDWSNSSPDATFSATGGTSGPSIMTEQSSVLLTYSGTAFDPIPVSLLVYDVANGQHAFVTKTATTVLVLATATIAPFNPFLASGDQQTFTVTVDDKLPASVQYLWSLTGRAGSIGAGGLVTTTPPSVQYTAIQQGIDTLSVQVLDALNNNLIAKTSTQVNVDQDPMKFTATIAGPWNPNPFIIQEPPDGTYSYTGGVGGRFAVDPGLDAVFFRYDIVGDAEGVTCILVVATGAALRAGETFATTVSGQPPTPGQFRVTLDPDQVNPTNTVYGPDATSGTLTIDSLVQTVDGVFVAHYSFRVQNNAGGTIMGSGVGRWT